MSATFPSLPTFTAAAAPEFLGWPRCMHWIKRMRAHAAVQLSCAVFPYLEDKKYFRETMEGLLGLRISEPTFDPLQPRSWWVIDQVSRSLQSMIYNTT
jgi:hypothetical protein